MSRSTPSGTSRIGGSCSSSPIATGRVLGTSMIYAQHGTRRAPHIFFRARETSATRLTLDRYFVHRVLRIGYNYNGPTEIGGLILLPEYRRNPDALGKPLSYVRFLFIAHAPPAVPRRGAVSSCCRRSSPTGPVQAVGGPRSPLHRADLPGGRPAVEGQQGVHPRAVPRRADLRELLPDDVQGVIGKVGPQTPAASRRCCGGSASSTPSRSIRSTAGRTFAALIDDVVLVRQTTRVRVDASAAPDDKAATFLVAHEQSSDENGGRGGSAHDRRGFVALATVAELTGESVRLPIESRSTLDVRDGDHVLVLSLS